MGTSVRSSQQLTADRSREGNGREGERAGTSDSRNYGETVISSFAWTGIREGGWCEQGMGRRRRKERGTDRKS